MNIDTKKLGNLWFSKYPDGGPQAEILRHAYKDRWVRFHSLEEGKRYPENPKEKQEILQRHYEILNELKPSDSIIILTSEWTNSPAPTPDEIEQQKAKRQGKYWMTFREDPDETLEEFIIYRHLYASSRTWNAGTIDDILIAVANDEMAGVIIAPKSLGWLYCPYDGGADIILANSEKRDALKKRHIDWLSSRSDGL